VLNERRYVCAAAVPVPLRDIISGEFVALLTTLILPAAAPALAGVNFAASGRL
jgi:hypothetical protein